MANVAKYDKKVKPYLDAIKGWCIRGVSDKEIADKLEIGYSTFFSYKNKYAELEEALTKKKDFADADIEGSLFKRAKGYDVEEIKTYIQVDKNGNERKRIEKTKRHIPPDVTAIIFYLKNRLPHLYKDKPTEAGQGEDFEKLKAYLKELVNNG